MGIGRILLYTVLAAVLAACAARIPVEPAPEAAATATEEPNPSPPAEEAAQDEPPMPAAEPAPESRASVAAKPPATTGAKSADAPRPKQTASGKRSRKLGANVSTPNVGSAEWKKQKAEDERKEEHIKQVIDGICSGC